MKSIDGDVRSCMMASAYDSAYSSKRRFRTNHYANPTTLTLTGSVALLIKQRNFPDSTGTVQTEPPVLASLENWSANDIPPAPSLGTGPREHVHQLDAG